MAGRRAFIPESKAKVVLEVISGSQITDLAYKRLGGTLTLSSNFNRFMIKF